MGAVRSLLPARTVSLTSGMGSETRCDPGTSADPATSPQRSVFSPVVARTTTSHAPTEPWAYDCVRISFVRSGSAILFSEFGLRPASVGDVIALAPCTLCGWEPEGFVTVTTLYLDRDFLVDQVFWQYASMFTDRLQAKQFVESRYAEPAQVVRLGIDRVGLLMPWLDELVSLSLDSPAPERFYKTQALLFAVLDVVVPYIDVTERRITTTQRTSMFPGLPRHRAFDPIRPEVRSAARLLRHAPERRWTLDALAEAVHLSPSHLGRLFVPAFGKTPIAYLTMLRAERMAHLLRTTDDPIATVARKVGWTDPDYAGRLFRRSIGITPRQYRSLSRRVPTADEPGGFAR